MARQAYILAVIILAVLLYSYLKLHMKKYAEMLKIILLVMAFIFAFYDKPIALKNLRLAFTPRVSLTILAGVELAGEVINLIQKKRKKRKTSYRAINDLNSVDHDNKKRKKL